MQWKHYMTQCVSHQNTCNYSLSAIDYNNYIDNYDWGKNLHLIPKFLFTILVEIEKWNIKADVYPCHCKKTVLILLVSVPHMANAMPIHMVKSALYPIIILFHEETIQLLWVTYTTKVFNPY